MNKTQYIIFQIVLPFRKPERLGKSIAFGQEFEIGQKLFSMRFKTTKPNNSRVQALT